MTLAPGTTLGPYQIVSPLGQGGMGVVYQALDPRLDRSVAIKLLPPELTRDETAKQRFLQEAKAASALDRSNICTIYEINETDDGQLYLVMAHYEGETLKERIARGPLELVSCNSNSRKQFPGGASGLPALLLGQICPIFSLVAPCQPGAAPGTLFRELLLQDTRRRH